MSVRWSKVDVLRRVHSEHPELNVDAFAVAAVRLGFQANEVELALGQHSAVADEEAAVIELEQALELARMPYRAYLLTSHWLTVRENALDRCGRRCQLCNAEHRLEVHHRTYERRGMETPTDVVVLCDTCHRRHHQVLEKAA